MIDREALEDLLDPLISTGYVGKPIDLILALLDAMDGDCDLEDASFVADYEFELYRRKTA